MTEMACPLCDESVRFEPNGAITQFLCQACGTYWLWHDAQDELGKGPSKNQRWVISAAVREAADRGDVPTITLGMVQKVRDERSHRGLLWDAIDRLLLLIEQRMDSFDDAVYFGPPIGLD
ncbi:MAG: hypothetical protein ABIZ70_07240 [Gemmatimonadales bacterium]